jgi:hypothetical protein
MIVVMWLLAIQGAIGAFDTLYYHEWRARLPARRSAAPELKLHAVRAFFYALLFGSLPWLAWQGALVLLLGAVLAAEIALTMADFVVEMRVRKPLGDVFAGERVTHAVMAIIYGAMAANLFAANVPVVDDADRARLGPRRSAGQLALASRGDGVGCVRVRHARFVCRTRFAGRRLALDKPLAGECAMIARRSFHRAVFLAAGLYNILWGLFSAWNPQWLFHFADMPPQNYPEVFAALAMVIGLYGILYLEVARVPERGLLLAAVGLLGPLGLLPLLVSGRWPIATAILCVTNDLIWWIPFCVYIFDVAMVHPDKALDAGEFGETMAAR